MSWLKDFIFFKFSSLRTISSKQYLIMRVWELSLVMRLSCLKNDNIFLIQAQNCEGEIMNYLQFGRCCWQDTIDCRADNAMKTAPNTISTLPQYHSYEPCTVCRVGGEGDRAGPLPCLPLISPMSVISSSTLEEPIPPSATTLGGAPKVRF